MVLRGCGKLGLLREREGRSTGKSGGLAREMGGVETRAAGLGLGFLGFGLGSGVFWGVFLGFSGSKKEPVLCFQ